MICSSCGTESPPGRKFCGTCGAPLALICPSCGTSNDSSMRFCGECGTSLTDPSLTRPERVSTGPTRQPAAAERRLVSVLFADLVGFTTLSESRDAEEVRELLSRYFDTCRTLIARYGGVVEKFIGDAVMAVFGAPVAFGDDAERAVPAGPVRPGSSAGSSAAWAETCCGDGPHRTEPAPRTPPSPAR